MTKWKGRVASMAPSLLLGTASATVLFVAGAQAETVNTAQTSALVSAVDEDHTITQDGSITLDPMNDRALVEINVAQYNQTLSNRGALSGTNANNRTHVGIGVNGLLAGTVSNSGSVTLSATGVSSADHRGIDLSDIQGTVTNSGSIDVTVDGSTWVQATGIYSGANSGTVSNSGDINILADGSSARAYGINLRATSGTVDNSGTISVIANGTGSSATAYGVRMVGLSGTFRNSGTIDVVANAGSEGSAYGITAYDVSGDLENTGTVKVVATGNTNPVALGIDYGDLAATGSITNAGTIDVQATGANVSTATAEGVSGLALVGTLTNSGTIRVLAAVNSASSVDAIGITNHNISGTLTNSGTLEVQALGLSASNVSAVGLEGRSMSGTVSNSGSILVNAVGGSWASAEGISVQSADGVLSNTGTIVARAQGTSSAYAGGISARTTAGSLSNSGDITVLAQGSTYAYATGINSSILFTGGSIQNSGNVVVLADAGSSSGGATGITSGFTQGTVTNSGTLQVGTLADGFAYAEGVSTFIVDTGAEVRNSGVLQVGAVSINSSATAVGLQSFSMSGTLENTGSIEALAAGTSARANGINLGSMEGGPFLSLTGQASNSGTISVFSVGTTEAVAYAIRTAAVEGSVTNTGDITVSAFAANGGLATGLDFSSVASTGTVTNSGDITVLADYTNATRYYAAGIGGGQMDGTMINSGNIVVTSTTVAPSVADAAFITGIGAFDVAGTLTHDGTIDLINAGGAGSQAYGIFANNLTGTLNVNGDIAARGADSNYAIYAGGGAGTLNINTSAILDGMIRVEDHDVNLTLSGGARVYQFEDANTAGGAFTTNVTIDNGVWFVSDAGGSAPVYASAIGEDFAANTLLPFQMGALADGLSFELAQSSTNVVSRTSLDEASGPAFETFARFGFSTADGTSIAGAEQSDLGSLTAGLKASAGDTVYGLGLSMASGISSLAANSTDTDGAFLSAEIARDFGFAELNFGLGYGQFDHNNTRTIGGSPDAIGEFGSTVQTAHIGIRRDFQLRDGSTLTPRVSFRKGIQDIEGYTETGSLANATLADRTVEFQEAKLGARFAKAAGTGTFSISFDAVHRSVSSPTLIDVSTFGSTNALIAGGSQDQTFGLVAVEFATPLGKNELLTIGASSQFGSSSHAQTFSAEYALKF